MKCLVRMYHDQGRDVIFYENAAAPHRRRHAAIEAVPLPLEQGEIAPAFFKVFILFFFFVFLIFMLLISIHAYTTILINTGSISLR